MRLDHLGTALFFLGVSYSIFRWVARTAVEASHAPPPITELEEQVLREAASRSAARLRQGDSHGAAR